MGPFMRFTSGFNDEIKTKPDLSLDFGNFVIKRRNVGPGGRMNNLHQCPRPAFPRRGTRQGMEMDVVKYLCSNK